tara:strand:- start:180979 stop:181590 length:612 start_codon:yes stop_codon:yes gene_type:complete
VKKIISCILSLTLFLSVNIYAQIPAQDIAECAVISGELDRLECYDQLARDNSLDGPQPSGVVIDGTGKWSVRVETNPLDDTTTVTLVLRADEGESRFGTPVGMVARCQSGETDIFIAWSEYLGSEAVVTHRIGQNDAVRSRWALSTDSQATFFNNPQDLLEQMLGEERLVTQVTPYNENPVTAIFDIRGLENAITPLRETCNW